MTTPRSLRRRIGSGSSSNAHYHCGVTFLSLVALQMVFNVGWFLMLSRTDGDAAAPKKLIDTARSRTHHVLDGAETHERGGGTVGQRRQDKTSVRSTDSAENDRNSNSDSKTGDDDEQSSGYDVITVVHHDDLDTLLEWGLQALNDNLIDFDGTIYAVGTVQAEEMLRSLKQQHQHERNNNPNSNNGNTNTSSNRTVWSRLHPVAETMYPFTKSDIKNTVSQKESWVYQQMLKLYAPRAFRSQGIPLRRHFLVIDADTVLLRPIRMQEARPTGEDGRRRWFVSIASQSTGAFEQDANAGRYIISELFDSGLTKAFPDFGKERFTAITHHMLFDGDYLDELLGYLEHKYDKPAWDILSSLQNSFLSEYELYVAWMMERHRQSIAVRPLSYVNWGRADQVSLNMARSYGSTYLTNHDDWNSEQLCCVNSRWPESSIEQLHAIDTDECTCCTGSGMCDRTHINCQVLGIDGCRDVESSEDGRYMVFDRMSDEYKHRWKQLNYILQKQSKQIKETESLIQGMKEQLSNIEMDNLRLADMMTEKQAEKMEAQ